MPDKPAIANPEKPHRRWYQFRLRTMLAGVFVLGSLCAGYLAHEEQVVRERWAIFRRLGRSGAVFVVTSEDSRYRRHAAPEVSWLRREMGDIGILAIDLQKSHSEELEAVAAAFPEAQVEVVP